MKTIWLPELLLRREHLNSTGGASRSGILEISDSPVEVALFTIIHVFGFAVSAYLILVLMLQRTKRKILRLKICMLFLLLVNALFCVGWLVFIVSMHFVVSPEDVESLRESWLESVAKELFLRQLVGNGLFLSGILILAVALDRYLNLFAALSPFIDELYFPILLPICSVFYSCVLLDGRVLSYILGRDNALFARICLLVIPHLMAFLFLLIASLRVAPPHDFEPRLNSSLARSFPRVNLVLLTIDMAARLAFFFRLLEDNFDFAVSTGSQWGDDVVENVTKSWFEVARYLYHAFPLIFALSNLLLVRHYRVLSERAVETLKEAVLCERRRTRVDYRSETLASIIAEQRKRRRFVASSISHKS